MLSIRMYLHIYHIILSLIVLLLIETMSRFGMRLTVAVAALISALDILHQFAGIDWAGAVIKSLPLHESSLAWLLPVLAALILSLFLPGKIRGETELELH